MPTVKISGSVALVTGASAGIGEATALLLAAAGARVLVHGRDEERLRALAARIGGRPLAVDLAEPGAAQRLAQAAGPVDILVNNAGIGWAGPFHDMSPDTVELLLRVNLTAPVELTRELLPGMLERGSGQLMYVTSIAGRMGVATEAVYAASKAGLDAFAESLRLELRGTGVRVGVLVPGVVDTGYFDRRGQPYRRSRPRPLPVGRVAGALVASIASDRAERYTPGWLRFPVAVRAALPGLYRRLAARFGE
jgi:short-subunit dehydrogenase